MLRKEILTEIEIDAGAQRVWGLLTDLPSYSKWNPVIRRASGELRPGARLSLRFAPAGRKGRSFRPKLLVVEPNRELRWKGNPGVPLLFESEHFFIIGGKPDEKSRLEHGIVYYGLFVPLVGKRLERATRGPFEEMNRALKERAELKPDS